MQRGLAGRHHAKPKPPLGYRCGRCHSVVEATLVDGWPKMTAAVRGGRRGLDLPEIRPVNASLGGEAAQGKAMRDERNVSLHTILRVARALDIPAELLLTGLSMSPQDHEPVAAGPPRADVHRVESRGTESWASVAGITTRHLDRCPEVGAQASGSHPSPFQRPE
jgi:hypothetical protein